MNPESTAIPPSNQPQRASAISPVQQKPLGPPEISIMDRFCRVSRQLIFPMAFVLPFWLAFGTSSGWLTLVFMFIFAPALFAILLVFYFLVSHRSDVVANRRLNPIDAVTLTVLYVSVFMYGLFVVNGADSTDSVNSDAMMLFGRGFQNMSQQLSGVFFTFSIVLIVLIFILLLYERFVKPLR